MVVYKKPLNLKSAGLSKEILLANVFEPVMPYKITFALTYRCNLKCKYCLTWARPVLDELKLEDIKRILNSATNLRWLQLTGGEIFLRNDIEEILNFAVQGQKLAVLTFPTNGMLTGKIVSIVKSLAKKLNGTKLIITCSLDGSKNMHEQLRGVGGSYEKCVETFKRLRVIEGVQAYFGVTLSKANFEDMPKLYRDLCSEIPGFTFDELHFNFAFSSFFYDNTSKEHSPEPIDQDTFFAIEQFRVTNRKNSIKYYLENKYFKLMSDYIRTKRSPVRCGSLHNSCFIDPYANVYPCISYDEKIGNLKQHEYNFKHFWREHLDKKNQIRKTIVAKKCPGCWTPCEAYPSLLTSLL